LFLKSATRDGIRRKPGKHRQQVEMSSSDSIMRLFCDRKPGRWCKLIAVSLMGHHCFGNTVDQTTMFCKPWITLICW